MPLTDTAIRSLKIGGSTRRLSDGGGLYLEVTSEGRRYWRLAYRFKQKQKTLAFGVYPHVSLADARTARDVAKRMLAAGTDPSEARRLQKRSSEIAAADRFESLALEWVENKRGGWTEHYHRQIMSRLNADVFPQIGSRPIGTIEPSDILALLRRVENRNALEMARRIRQTIGLIFRYGIVTGRAKRDPAADLKGALRSAARRLHHKAMPREDIPVFFRSLEAYDGDPRTRLALKLAVLTFVRTGELRAARWNEIDLSTKEWRIPSDRMKMRTPHIVPLSKQAVAAFTELHFMSGGNEFVFPSGSREGFMSNNTMLFALYRLGFHGRATVHGFRAVASTMLNEMGFHPDWIERQLAHDDRNKVRAAYNHAQYLAERRHMMQVWADHLDTLVAKAIPVASAAKAV